MTTDGGEWLTVQEAAKLSGYHPEYIRRLIRDGEITAKKFSIVWMVKRKSLLSYLEKARNSEDRRYTPKR
jgi:excisionase family DNA binding protein